jgi:hypothetical protein
MILPRRIAPALTAASVVAVSMGARAQAPPTVLLIRDTDTAGLALRLSRELAAMGVRVVQSDAPAREVSREDLELAAQRAGALAAFRLRPSQHGVDVWLFDRATSKFVLRDEVLLGDADEDQRVVAVRAVELLRASLLEVSQPTFAPRPTAAPLLPQARAIARAIIVSPPPGWPRLAMHFGGGALVSEGGVEASGHAALDAAWAPHVRARIGVAALFPTIAPMLRTSSAEASLSTLLVSARATGQLLPTTSRFAVRVGAELGVGAISIMGVPSEGYVGSQSVQWIAVTGGLASVSLALGAGFVLTAEGRAVVGLPGLSIRFADVEVARYAQLSGVFTIALGIER